SRSWHPPAPRVRSSTSCRPRSCASTPTRRPPTNLRSPASMRYPARPRSSTPSSAAKPCGGKRRSRRAELSWIDPLTAIAEGTTEPRLRPAPSPEGRGVGRGVTNYREFVPPSPPPSRRWGEGVPPCPIEVHAHQQSLHRYETCSKLTLPLTSPTSRLPSPAGQAPKE